MKKQQGCCNGRGWEKGSVVGLHSQLLTRTSLRQRLTPRQPTDVRGDRSNGCVGHWGITWGQNANLDSSVGFSGQPTPPASAQRHSLPAKWLSALEAGPSSSVVPGGPELQALGSWEGR